MVARLRFHGVDDVIKNIEKMGRDADRANRDFSDLTTLTLAERVRQAAPEARPFLSVPNLRESIETTLATRGPTWRSMVAVNVDYAARVHENPRTGKTMGFSPKGEPYDRFSPIGGDKFVEGPTLELVDRLASDWAAYLSRRVFR